MRGYPAAARPRLVVNRDLAPVGQLENVPEFLAVLGRGRGAADIFVRILCQCAHGDPLPQNIAQGKADPQPALDLINLGKALVPEDEPPRAVEHAEALGHEAERGVAQILLRASCRAGQPAQAGAEAEADHRASGDKPNAVGLFRDHSDRKRRAENNDAASDNPHGSGAPARPPHADKDTTSGKGSEQADAARQDDKLPVASDREE